MVEVVAALAVEILVEILAQISAQPLAQRLAPRLAQRLADPQVAVPRVQGCPGDLKAAETLATAAFFRAAAP